MLKLISACVKQNLTIIHSQMAQAHKQTQCVLCSSSFEKTDMLRLRNTQKKIYIKGDLLISKV